MDWEKRIVKSVRLFNILNLDITICFVAKNIISIQQYTDFLVLTQGREGFFYVHNNVTHQDFPD